MFIQSIATGCIQDRLWCVLSLLQKLMDLFSGTDFPDQLLKAENVEECYRLACAEIGNLE